MKVGDLVKSLDGGSVGVITKLFLDASGWDEPDRGAWVLWDYGAVEYADEEELEVIK